MGYELNGPILQNSKKIKIKQQCKTSRIESSISITMPDSSFLKLSIFVTSEAADPLAGRSLRSFADGAVGLGIISALNGGGDVGGRVRSVMLTRS